MSPRGLPRFMDRRHASGGVEVVHLKPHGAPFDPDCGEHQKAFNEAVARTILKIRGLALQEPVLMKVHVGEPRCKTALRPALAKGALSALARKGRDRVCFGDTTVIYSGPRGGRENDGRAITYLDLARKKGWAEAAPFVVLDRPKTSVPGLLEFVEPEIFLEGHPKGRFRRVSLSGGAAAAGAIVQHAHLTLHGLAHMALCVKGLTMGLAGREGKLAMHQCLHPAVDDDTCVRCGACIEACPEDALAQGGDGLPELQPEICIGCGECLAVCPEGAISMCGEAVSDWGRGADSLPYRMTDYLMGMLAGRFDRLINVAHLYDVTPLCDCVNTVQDPICENLGILVGRNPFAVDRAARCLLEDALPGGVAAIHEADTGQALFEYAQDRFGVATEPRLDVVEVNL